MQEESVPPPPHKNSAGLFFRPALFLLAMFVVIHLCYAFCDLLACSIQPLSHSSAFIHTFIMTCVTCIGHEALTAHQLCCLGELFHPCRNKYILHPLGINLYLHNKSLLVLVRMTPARLSVLLDTSTLACSSFLCWSLSQVLSYNQSQNLSIPTNIARKNENKSNRVGFSPPSMSGLIIHCLDGISQEFN